MDKKRFAKRVAVAAGFFFLCTATEPVRGQSNPPSPEQAPRKAAPVARPQKVPSKGEDFAGLNYSDEQKAKIDQIHQTMKSRMDAVAKDEKLTKEQKDAMLDGYERMERSQIYKELTSEQQKQVRVKIRARHAAEQEQKKKQLPPK